MSPAARKRLRKRFLCRGSCLTNWQRIKTTVLLVILSCSWSFSWSAGPDRCPDCCLARMCFSWSLPDRLLDACRMSGPDRLPDPRTAELFSVVAFFAISELLRILQLLILTVLILPAQMSGTCSSLEHVERLILILIVFLFWELLIPFPVFGNLRATFLPVAKADLFREVAKMMIWPFAWCHEKGFLLIFCLQFCPFLFSFCLL